MRRGILLLLLIALAPMRAAAQDTAYCNITSIRAVQLSNGVQITVRADGVLEYRQQWGGSRVQVFFANAKSQVGKNFIDVSKYPVSYIQLTVPQDARQGVGIQLVAALYEEAEVNVERSNDQQSVIITVNSPRTIVKRTGTGGAETVAPPSATTQVRRENGALSVYAVKAKLVALLAEVGRRAGADIVVDDSVKDREVSMTLEVMNLDDVLRAISGAAGLAISVVDGVYMISDGVPTDLATYHLSSTESFRMKYTRAQAASGLLPTFLYSFLHVNEAQNAVVVTAPTQMLDKIRADFGKIDVAPSQIMIEALAVEVSSTQDADASLGLTLIRKNLFATAEPAAGDITWSTIGQLPS